MWYTTEKGVEDRGMCYKEQVKKYLEYCEFRKELDSNIPYLTKFNNFCQQIHLNTDYRQQNRFPDFKNGTRTPSTS